MDIGKMPTPKNLNARMPQVTRQTVRPLNRGKWPMALALPLAAAAALLTMALSNCTVVRADGPPAAFDLSGRASK